MTATSNQSTRVYVGTANNADASVVFGRPDAAAGSILVYAPGRVAAYRIASERGCRCYVFRTLTTVDALASRVAGVAPRVRLLFEVTGQTRCVRTVRLLQLAQAQTGSVDRLDDDFFARLATASWRLTPRDLVRVLLREVVASSAATMASTGRSERQASLRDSVELERR